MNAVVSRNRSHVGRQDVREKTRGMPVRNISKGQEYSTCMTTALADPLAAFFWLSLHDAPFSDVLQFLSRPSDHALIGFFIFIQLLCTLRQACPFLFCLDRGWKGNEEMMPSLIAYPARCRKSSTLFLVSLGMESIICNITSL